MRLECGHPGPPPAHPMTPATHAFMLLPLPLSTMYGVFWAFCFSWSKATVPRGVSLELIFFRSCGGTASQHHSPPATPEPADVKPPQVNPWATHRLLVQLLHPPLCLHLARAFPVEAVGQLSESLGTRQNHVRAACVPQDEGGGHLSRGGGRG